MKTKPPVRSRRPRSAAPQTVEVAAGVFKNTCLALMDEVQRHRKEVVITKYGRPVARLVAIEETTPTTAFGFMRGTVLEHGDIVSPDFAAWGEPDPGPAPED